MAERRREDEDRPPMNASPEHRVWARAIGGFIILLPLLIAIAAIVFVAESVDGVFRGDESIGLLNPVIKGEDKFLSFLDFYGFGIIILIALLVLLYAFGALIAFRVGRRAKADGAALSGDVDEGRPSMRVRAERHFWGHVLGGFFVLLPLIITIFIIVFIFEAVDGLFRGDDGIGMLNPIIKGDDKFLSFLDFPGFGIIVMLVLLYFFGVLMTIQVGRRAVDIKIAILSHIPVVKNVYGVARQATSSLTAPDGHEVSRVVFVEWPRKGSLAMGFTTGQSHPDPNDDTELIVVYIPTVPNPTSGNLAFVPESDVYETTLTVDQAMKTVFSGGIVIPPDLGMITKPAFNSGDSEETRRIQAAADAAAANKAP